MDSNSKADTVHEAYLESQRQLWDRWMEIAWRFEVASMPEHAWWAIPYRNLDEQLRDVPAAADMPTNRAWLQLWQDGLDNGQGIVAAVIEWNRRIVEQQARANREFLEAWSETVRRSDDENWDNGTRRSFEVLQEAVERALLVPSGESASPAANQDQKREHGGKGNPDGMIKKIA